MVEFSWILRILKQCYKHKRGMPPPEPTKAFTPSAYQPQPQTPQAQPSATTLPTPTSGIDADRNGGGSASTSTLPPLDAEFLAELDFSGSGAGAGGGAGMFAGDGIDWDALMSDGELWANIGGGWNEGDLTGGFGGT